jgi:hypothetical protein
VVARLARFPRNRPKSFGTGTAPRSATLFAVGGNQASSRAIGVPDRKVEIGRFMTVSFLGWFVRRGHTSYKFNTLQADNVVDNAARRHPTQTRQTHNA